MSWKGCDCGFCKPKHGYTRKSVLIQLGIAIGFFIIGTAAIILLISNWP